MKSADIWLFSTILSLIPPHPSTPPQSSRFPSKRGHSGLNRLSPGPVLGGVCLWLPSQSSGPPANFRMFWTVLFHPWGRYKLGLSQEQLAWTWVNRYERKLALEVLSLKFFSSPLCLASLVLPFLTSSWHSPLSEKTRPLIIFFSWPIKSCKNCTFVFLVVWLAGEMMYANCKCIISFVLQRVCPPPPPKKKKRKKKKEEGVGGSVFWMKNL